ncbi:hypothetical protein AB0395_22200 [Streptosporangium sp. NPDC051023]|uniref:hypothetical protein n=1 Tax=Streptosporangium sp. NPDC051023 TaxID=3155410 RepID=UPI003450063B
MGLRRYHSDYTSHLERVSGVRRPFVPRFAWVPVWSSQTGEMGAKRRIVAPWSTYT